MKFSTSIIALSIVLAVSSCKPVDSSGDSTEAYLMEQSDLFGDEVARSQKFLETMMEAGVVVPIPKDPGGGYTHEQHKLNYKAIYEAGQLYKINGDQKYADYARDMLLAYAELYPTLADHPARKNQNPGRIFWQVLNDAVWLVHSIQGYEAIRESLSNEDRDIIDNQVFRKAAAFLSTGSAKTFQRIHNHATWATAGVGMTGFVLDDKELVDIALLGLDKSGKSGFLRQTELLFSPDGYYTEGPYYQRYALMPFIVFASAIEKNDPDRKIFEHRDGILLKALRTTIQLTYGGLFFPFNDAIKDKSLNTDELYHGVAIAYAQTRDPALLSIAYDQGRTVLTDDGKLLSDDLAAGKAEEFPFQSLLLSDGPEGKKGAVAIFRHGEGKDHQAIVAKNTSQGMGHGHFDKLSWQYYDNGNEIIRDYGAARFLNIEAKEGGRYLPENESWAKQSIAHNTLVVDSKSHFDGDVKLADSIAPKQLYYSDDEKAQISSANITGAYPDTNFTRTLALMPIEGLSAPILLDIVRVQSSSAHQYDLPLHYSGHIMRTGFNSATNVNNRPVLGSSDGYQHIWVDAIGQSESNQAFLTWILDGRFYSYRFKTPAGAQIILAESGANDPNFNLRRDPIIIQRLKGQSNATFVSLLETHGRYDGAAEQTVNSDSQIKSLEHISDNGYDVVIIETLAGKMAALGISYDQDPSKKHALQWQGQSLIWSGYSAAISMKARGDSHE